MMRTSMTRRALAASVAWLALTGTAGAQAPDAAAIHKRVLVLDSHVDVLLPDSNPRYRAKDGQSYTSLEKLNAGGVDAVVYTVAVSNGDPTADGYAAAAREADAKLAAIQRLAADSGGRIEIAKTSADVTRIVGAGKVAVLPAFQNAFALGEDLGAFDRFYAGGVQVAALNHAGNNAFADSSRPRPGTGAQHGGLSPLGQAAVKRFNDLGVLIDVSQLTEAGVLQTLALSRAPVVATHSDVRALVDNSRNLSDAEIDGIAKAGGVIQVTPFNSYLVAKPQGYDDALRALRSQYGLDPAILTYAGADALPKAESEAFFAAYGKLYPKADVKALVDHIDYIAKRVGVDHVGVGTDFNHGAGIPGFADASEAGAVTAELVRRGYAESDIAKIWGGNFLRVLDAAQAAKTL